LHKDFILIEIGKHHDLEILRHTSVGLFLGDESGEDVLLPNKYCPEEFEIGDTLNVFVYRDFAERKVATNLMPKVLLHEFALLKAAVVNEVGAFMDWGLEKHLLVPFSEQRMSMEEGRWYIVYLDLDGGSDRLFGSNKIDKILSNKELRVTENEEVDLLVYHESELGFSVIVNNCHDGLLYKNEVFQVLDIGDNLKGFVKKIRPENKLDISLNRIGFKKVIDENAEHIYKILKEGHGFLELSDKSSPNEIYVQLNMSKKAFKKAIGNLYKEKRIIIEENQIRLPK
jgi:uncharacterized protein